MATIWYQLVHASGESYCGTTPDKVLLPNANSDVADLRKEVKAKCANDLEKVDANKLLVYASAEALEKDKDEPEPKHWLKAGKTLESVLEEAQDNSDDNPLLIVVPERSQPTTSEIESEERLVNKVLEKLKRQDEKTRHGSSINSGDLNDVLKFTGVALLKEDAVALKKVPSVAGTMPFTWGSNVEHMQTPQTIEWLKNALQFEMDSQVTIEAYHTTKKAHFGFPLSAKVDLRVAVANNSVCFIELKKSVDPQAERQAVAEACLFLRDTTPEISATGVIVLTDLHDFWQVLYFSAAESGASTKKLHVVNVDREKGLGAIKLAVLECTKELYEFGVHVERMDRINREIAEFPNSPLKKRIKLVHLSPESSQLIRMQDLAESEEERSLLRKRLWLSLFADNCEPEEQRTYRDTEQGMRNEWLPMYV